MAGELQSTTGAGRTSAEEIAVAVFEFIAAEIERTVKFLRVTGLEPDTIRESAKSAHFLRGALEYASKDEELLKTIESELSIRPGTILVAAVQLMPTKEGEKVPLETAAGRSPQIPRRNLFH